MAAQRGSTMKLAAIKEVTYGTTPATPVGLELPMVSFAPKEDQQVLRSAQIRTHPFVDKMLVGRFMHTIGAEFELQAATHDILLETVFGSVIATKAMKFLDALKSLTTEDQVSASLFNSYTGVYFSKLSITAAANDTAPVRCSLDGMSKAAVLDAGATVFTSVTSAGNPDPYVFADATLTVAAVSTDVVSGTINFERQVDPLGIWGSRVPREFIPSDVTATGTITVPYDTGAQSTIAGAFTDAALVFKFAANGGATYRQFTFPKTKFVSLGRPVQNRGVRLQEINWEAYYDSTSATICTLATE